MTTAEITEVSPKAYLDYISQVLRTHRYVIDTELLAELAYNHFHGHFTEGDLKSLKKRDYPKWKNNLDWAKSRGTRLKWWRTVKLKGKRYLVATNKTGSKWIEQNKIKLKPPKKSFMKLCPKCQANGVLQYVRLQAKTCSSRRCGYKFPPPNPRITPK